MRPLGAYIVWGVLAVVAAGAFRARRGVAGRSWPLILAAVAIGSITAFAVMDWGRATPLGDFNKAYYPAGRQIVEEPSRLYACEVSNRCFVNLPFVALLFAPIAALPRLTAQVLFTLIGAAAVVAAVGLTVREFGVHQKRRAAVIAVFVLNGPLLYSARLGNLSHALLPLLVVAFTSLARGRDVRAGVLLALLTVIKLPLLLFLPYFLFRKRLIAAAAFVASLGVIGAVSLVLFGPALHLEWLWGSVEPFARRPIAAYNVQSASGLLARLVMPGNLTNWMPLDVTPLFTAVRYGVVLTLMTAVASTLLAGGPPRDRMQTTTELHIVLTLALITSPLTWTHYYAFLTLPLAAYAAGRVPMPGIAWRAAVAAVFVLVSLPVVLPRVPSAFVSALVERVLISHYTWGGMLLLAVLCRSRLAAFASATTGGQTTLQSSSE